jgi:hypothetical protein
VLSFAAGSFVVDEYLRGAVSMTLDDALRFFDP